MPKTSTDYPDLADLISGWFHQDFDIEGDTIEEIVAAFCKCHTQVARNAVIADINKFLDEHVAQGEVDSEFNRIFTPDIVTTAFATDTQAFLQEIARYLAK